MRHAFRIGLLLAVFFTTTPRAGVVQSHGALKVKGNQIVDASGAPIQVAGMSLFWSGWMGKYWNSGVVNTLADSWNSSLVRAAMGVEGNGNYLVAQSANKTMVKTVVDAAIAKDIYVIIDWHDHNATNHVNESVAFFEEMSRTYGNKPHVIFEIFNEPLKIPWTDIKSYSEKVIAAIRKNSNNLIIVGTPNWSQDVDVAASNPLSDANTAYTLHFYSGTHGASLRNKANTALSRGVALFITEWGTTNADGGTVDSKVYTAESDTWLAWARDKKLSWANWSVADKAEASAALKPGTSANGGWSDANLTQSGLYVKGKIREVTAAISSGSSAIQPSALPDAKGMLAARRTSWGLELELPADIQRLRVRDIHGRILSELPTTTTTAFLPVSGSQVLLLEATTSRGMESLKVAPLR
ncbi:MAG: glycoside hydrolase family 5 protein [Fibrobacteres bacterium]|nr:glycoside hydrolase family 5 protein [Fibrobacterota bacterium]